MRFSLLNRHMKVFFICLVVIAIYILFFLQRQENFSSGAQLYTVKTPSYDGLGAQYHALMSGIAYCAHKGYTYVHTPFEGVSHGGNATELNDFIGIRTPMKPENATNIITEPHSEEVHWSENPSKYYTEEVLTSLRQYYYSTKKPNISPPEIALHIRRGDVDSNDGKRFTTNEDNKRVIQMLQQKYPDYMITIFSEGADDDFADLVSDNVTLKLNGSVTDTFHSFVTAKVLVTAKSSLSYSAAILNENTVYYQDFWHKTL